MTTPHNIFYDKTGIEITPAIDRALKLIIKQSQNSDINTKLEKAMRDLVGAMHKELLETQLVTPAQWNAGLAPFLSELRGYIEKLPYDKTN